jgi:hypothetical protein
MKSLDYLCAAIGDLDIKLPQEFNYRHVVINHAMDVRSASMLFLSSHIKHDRTLFGTAGTIFDGVFILTKSGKVAKIFFIGDEHITGPDTYLKFTVEQYNAALAKFHVHVGLKTYELGRKTYEIVQGFLPPKL